jgi:methyl-accepting chemotaxis protein
MEVRSAATEMNKGSQVILEEIANLETASKEIEASIKEMNDGATQIEKNGATLAEISGAMDKSISKIGEQIDLFQV